MIEKNKNTTSEESFRRLLNFVSDSILVINQEGVVLAANKAIGTFLRIDSEELIGESLKDSNIFDAKTKMLIISHLEKRMKGEAVENFEIPFLVNGETKYVEPKGNRVDFFGNPADLIILHDVTNRKKKAAEQVKYLQEFLQLQVDRMPIGLIVFDTEFHVKTWNPSATRIFGFTQQEASGKHPYELIVPKQAQLQTDKIWSRLLKGDTTANCVNENITKDGRTIICDWSNTPLREEDGTVVAVLSMAQDITERKKAQEQLKNLKDFDERIIDSLGDALLIIDPEDFTILNANKVAHEQLKLERKDMVGKTCYEATHFRSAPCETPNHICPIRELKNTGKLVTVEHTHFDSQQNEVIVEVSAYPVKNEQEKNVVIHIAKDITKRKLMEQELKESETKYRQLVNVAQEGIWAFDNNYRTVFVNPRMVQMLGYSESEFVGKSIFEFLDKKHIEQAKQFLGQFKQGFKGHFDYTFARKDGSRSCVSIEASVINDDGGKPVGTLAMVSDITVRKALEAKVNNYSKHLKSMVELRTAQLKHANEQLVKSERLAAVGELAGMVGHDLRNPLAGIKNAAYFLKKKGTTISETQTIDMLGIIEKAIDHADKIINDLLDYSREMHLELIESTLPTLLDESIRMVQVPDRIQILNHVNEETKIKVDTDKMMRVFINLIKNAVEAIPEKGKLEITSHKTQGNLEIAFADTGKGIPEEVLPKLFTPLFTTKAQGMGFGLSICRRIVESHGGRITVETVVNKGTTFTITLPIRLELDVGNEETLIIMPDSLLSTTKA